MDLTFQDLIQYFGPSAGVIAVLGYVVRQLTKWYNEATERAEIGRQEAQKVAEERFNTLHETFRKSIDEIRSAYEKERGLANRQFDMAQEQIRVLEVQNQRDRADYQSRSLAIEKEHSAVMRKITETLSHLIARIDGLGQTVSGCSGRAAKMAGAEE